MDLRDLSYFETIAETEHLGVAAEQLGRTKPALTKSIRRLELDLNAKLFVREGRRIVLTPVGEALLMRTRRLKNTVEDIRRDVSELSEGLAGQLRIGTGPTVAEYFLPTLIKRLVSDLPKVKTEIVVEFGDQLRKNLVGGKLDIIISTISPDDLPQFFVHPFSRDQVVAAARPDHPLALGFSKLEDFLKYSWVLPGPTVATRKWIDWAFVSRGLPPPDVKIETSSLHVLPTLIADTDFLTFTPKSNLGEGRIASALREIPCGELTMQRELGLVTRQDKNISPVVMRVVDLLSKGIRTIGKR
jgi:DNA-binding transcriptional LysR family regulator